MGELNQHDLNEFGCNIFIETGTGKGTGIEYACLYPFKALHTIEIIPELYEFSRNKIKDDRVIFHLGHSVEILSEVLTSIDRSDRILFWLDAHFPGVDFGLGIGKYVFDEENMPVEKELLTIKKYREGCQDSFIIDDLRFYEDGNYQLGNIDIGKPKSGIGFIEEFFKGTHKIGRDFRHQGFLIIKPVIGDFK
jgi:hypothetical protein